MNQKEIIVMQSSSRYELLDMVLERFSARELADYIFMNDRTMASDIYEFIAQLELIERIENESAIQ